jgi:hypothetical protein
VEAGRAPQAACGLEIKEAAMDIQALPHYRGLPDSLKGWGEPDGHGKRPSLGLHDYVVLSLLILICLPTILGLVIRLWDCHGYVEAMERWQSQQMEQELSRSLPLPMPHEELFRK